MKLLYLLCALCVFSSTVFAKGTSNYSQQDLALYQKTGVCQGCELVRVSWIYNEYHPKGQPNYESSTLNGAYLDQGDFSLVDFNRSTFISAKITQAKAQQLDAAFCDFSNANLAGTNFTKAILVGSNFQGANFKNCDLEEADFTQANVTLEQLNQASNLCNTILPDGTRHAC